MRVSGQQTDSKVSLLCHWARLPLTESGASPHTPVFLSDAICKFEGVMFDLQFSGNVIIDVGNGSFRQGVLPGSMLLGRNARV